MSDDLRKLKVDDKWSILYDAGQNDRPLGWYRYDELHTSFSNFNANVAMFYAFQEATDRIEQLAATNEELEKACKEWAEVSQANYQRAKAAEEKLAEMQVVGDAMAASIEGNYYVAGIAKMWRDIAKIKGEQP